MRNEAGFLEGWKLSLFNIARFSDLVPVIGKA